MSGAFGARGAPALDAVPTVLDRADPAHLVREPFPHIVVRDAIPADWCRALIDSYPEPALVGARPSRSNKRWDLPVHRVLEVEGIAEPWKQFLSAHVGNAFYQRVIDVFGEAVIEMYPELAASVDALRGLRTGVRGADPDAEVRLDALLAGNTPARSPNRSIGPHVDHPQKLFAGLFYLRRDDDDTPGGDLQILEPRTGAFRFHAKRRIHDGYTRVVRTVAYDKNVLVMLLNGRMSWHGVTPRGPGREPRLFMNLVGELPTPLFRIEPRESRREGLRRRLGLVP